MAWLTRRMRTLEAMFIGIIMATIGVLVAGWTTSAYMLIGGILFFSLGEMMTGPKKIEYLGLIAPPGKKGLYLGYVNIPVGVGVYAGSKIAGHVYGHYGEKAVLALKYLLNREQMKSAIFQGYAVLANDQPIDPTNRFYFPGLKQRPFDPEKAKFHLQRSGLGNTTIPLHAMASSTMLDQAVLIQQAAQQIGLTVDVKRMPADGYWSNVWMKQPRCSKRSCPPPTGLFRRTCSTTPTASSSCPD